MCGNVNKVQTYEYCELSENIWVMWIKWKNVNQNVNELKQKNASTVDKVENAICAWKSAEKAAVVEMAEGRGNLGCGMATVSRIDKIIGLFCRILSLI